MWVKYQQLLFNFIANQIIVNLLTDTGKDSF